MKNYLIVALACLVAALAFGIKPVQEVVNKTVNGGTLKGAETCMDYSASQLLSADAVKAMCIQAFQKPLFSNDHATGQAGPRVNQQTVGWGGVLENKTSDHVTTWVRISVIFFDKDGAEQEIFAETPIWIDPLGEAEFKVELPELKPEKLNNIEFCDHDDEAPKACMTWGIVEVMGLAV